MNILSQIEFYEVSLEINI